MGIGLQPKRTARSGPAGGARLTPARDWPRVVFTNDEKLGRGKAVGESPRIMIVEDDYLVAWQMENALAESGFEIAGVAQSVEQALEIAARERPSLAIMDIRLSGKRDGIDGAIELFARHGIRCIFASAHQNPDARSRASSANPLAWLPKPYTMTSLVETVRQALLDLRRGPR